MNPAQDLPLGVQVIDAKGAAAERVLTPAALAFVARLERQLGPARAELLSRRTERQEQLDSGQMPQFLAETLEVREDPSWLVALPPPDLTDRRVEITGPVERKMIINALNSGAKVFMADFEDANSPTWANCLEGQCNLIDSVERTISLESGGKRYQLNQETATLLVRPRGWHLPEKHLLVDGRLISASLFDFGLFVFHCAQALLERGSGLWNQACRLAEDELELPRGAIRTTVLIETVLAAFEMEEILYELRERCTGLNAGRWDYMFSIIKKFRYNPQFILPDRGQVVMTVPFMRAYTELLVRTCHKRRTHAIGGMAAFVPSRRDPELNQLALEKVREDKLREAGDGFDGTWVAHPDLVGVAQEVFDKVLGERPNQIERQREEVSVTAEELLDVAATPGDVTDSGVQLGSSTWPPGSTGVAQRRSTT